VARENYAGFVRDIEHQDDFQLCLNVWERGFNETPSTIESGAKKVQMPALMNGQRHL